MHPEVEEVPIFRMAVLQIHKYQKYFFLTVVQEATWLKQPLTFEGPFAQGRPSEFRLHSDLCSANRSTLF